MAAPALQLRYRLPCVRGLARAATTVAIGDRSGILVIKAKHKL